METVSPLTSTAEKMRLPSIMRYGKASFSNALYSAGYDMANVTGPQFNSVPDCKEREKLPGTGSSASDQETVTAPESSPHSPIENVKPVKPPPMLSPKFVEGYVVGDTS